MKNVNLKTQLEAFGNNIYLDSDGTESHCYNFYDWFCNDNSLKAKADKLFKATAKFINKFEIDINTHYVFFKNNCPMSGSLYDSFSIVNIESSDVVYWVTPKSGHNGMAEICGKANDFKEPLYSGNTISEIYKNIGK
jgi:hypothetical protein